LLGIVRRTVKEHHMFEKGQRVLCALSGGADSMAMLHALKCLGANVCACHFEHGIRGESSVSDMEFVKAYCEKNGIGLYVGRGDVPRFAKEQGMSLEAAARKLRYEALENAMAHFGADVCATAHHLDDQAETVLLRLVRGAGDGLMGIPYVNGRYIRPLRDVSKAEIFDYIRENDIPFVHDETNDETDLPRNLIRNAVMPALFEINKAAARNITRSMAMSASDSLYLDDLAAPYIKERINCKEISGLPEPIRRRVLRGFAHLIGAKNIEHSHIEALEKLLYMRTGQSLDLSNASVINENGVLKRKNEEESAFEMPVIEGKAAVTPVGTFEFIKTDVPKDPRTGRNMQYFDLDKLEALGMISVRNRREGDRISPIGIAGEKKLKDIFIDKKIPRDQRDRIPIFTAGDTLIWVKGVCASGKCAIDKDTKRAAMIIQKDN